MYIFTVSVIIIKIGKRIGLPLSNFQLVSADFTVVTKLKNVLKRLYGFAGSCQEITDICMHFELYLKKIKAEVHTT